jgi:hypothetical protein
MPSEDTAPKSLPESCTERSTEKVGCEGDGGQSRTPLNAAAAKTGAKSTAVSTPLVAWAAREVCLGERNRWGARVSLGDLAPQDTATAAGG